MKKVSEILNKYVGAYKLSENRILVVHKNGRVQLYKPDSVTISCENIAYWKYSILDNTGRFRRYAPNMTKMEFLTDFSDDCLRKLVKYGYSNELDKTIFSIDAMDDCYVFKYYSETNFKSFKIECKNDKMRLDILEFVFYKNRHKEVADCIMNEIEKFLSKLEPITIQESMLE